MSINSRKFEDWKKEDLGVRKGLMNAAGKMHHRLEAKGHNITISEVLILSELSLLRPLTSYECNNKLLDFPPVNFLKMHQKM